MGTQIFEYLDSVAVAWTTIDVVRFAEVEKDPGPIVLWIGVKPGSLSRDDAQVATTGCANILDKFKITGLDIAFRESLFTRYSPKLMNNFFWDTEIDIRGPLTPALGLPIASRATLCAEGTGAIYLYEDHNSEKIYILTARHVVFPHSVVPNELYDRMRTTKRRYEVILPGPKAFQAVLRSTMAKISKSRIEVNHYGRVLEELRKKETSGDNTVVEMRRTEVEFKLKNASASIKNANQFHNEVTKYWSEESQRIIGHIAYSPPITVDTGTTCHTEDWALIEIDRKKINWDDFRGNVIDLGTKISPYDFSLKMYPADHNAFEYPYDSLFPVHGVVTEDELRHPHTHDADGELCLNVTKNGGITGTTIGRATGIKSIVRECFSDGNHRTSMELAILGYDHESREFSAPGDSGAIIVDGRGRIAGLLTGGSGLKGYTDITYATPFYWLWEECIKTRFPNAHLYQAPAEAS